MGPHLILFGAVLAQLADAVTFAAAIAAVGIKHEANAIAAGLYQLGGLPAVIAAKGALILLVLALLVVAAHRYPRVFVMGGATATSLGLLGGITNAWSLAILA